VAYRVRLFVDFWNFQLQWNEHLSSEQQCDWPRLPARFVAQAQTAITDAGIEGALQLEETRVYASYNPARAEDTRLQGWLSNFLDRQASFRVFSTERKDKPARVHCRACDRDFDACPSCSAPLVRSREKGVDTAIVTDLLSLAWEGAFDVAVLVSSDADMIPCVHRVQEKGFKVINATWPIRGQALAQACWASFGIMPVAPGLVRPGRTTGQAAAAATPH
jgi:uncharacterized LabA/DUF88 family protein